MFFFSTASAIQRFLEASLRILDPSKIRRARSCLVTSKGSSSNLENNFWTFCILHAFWIILTSLKTSWIRVELKRRLPRAHQVEAFHRSPHAHPSKNVTVIPCDDTPTPRNHRLFRWSFFFRRFCNVLQVGTQKQQSSLVMRLFLRSSSIKGRK